MLSTASVGSSLGVDGDLVPDVHEERHGHSGAGLQLSRLVATARRVALNIFAQVSIVHIHATGLR